MRQANIEILRGLLMLFVVGCHVLNLGVCATPPLLVSGDKNYLEATLLDSFFMVAVDSFVIISGYFGIKLKAKKMVGLLLPVYFYSIIIGLVSHLLNIHNFTLSNLLPIYRNSYWFLTSYLILCLMSPFLNSFVEKNQKRALLKILICFLLAFSIIPSFTFFSLTHDDGFGIVNFILLYLIGRFIAINASKFNKPWLFWLSIHILIVMIVFGESVITGNILNYNRGYQSLFYHYDNIFIIMGGVSLFLTFLNISISNHKIATIACWLSPSFFYIYIIHCTSPLCEILFDIVDESHFVNSDYFIAFVLLAAIGIFLLCLFIDIILRRLLLQKVFFSTEAGIMRIFNYIEKTFNKYK